MYAVILAGGGGTRLWPLSRVARPKPFLPLTGESTLLQQTVARLAPLILPRDVYVVADARYLDLIREQLPDLPAANVVTEPVGRNTAAAVALAALAIERPGDDVMVILPADHAIADESGFRDALAVAGSVASDGRLVTLGIRPSGPETGYGYVLATGDPTFIDGRETFDVEQFVEKPTVERAGELLASGRAHWNAGIFIWRRDAVLSGLERHAHDIVGAIRRALADGSMDVAYPTIRSTSIDYGLLEPVSLEGRVSIVPADIGWSDVGSWAALLDALAADDGVVAMSEGASESLDIESRDILVHAAGGRLVVTVGLDGVIVVDTPDAILICSRDRAQDVKRVVDRLVADGRSRLL